MDFESLLSAAHPVRTLRVSAQPVERRWERGAYVFPLAFLDIER
jgi:hypothetical protein